MRYTKYCRSMLFTPATAVTRYQKSHRSRADICVVDLEDSVAGSDKEHARLAAESFFTHGTARCAIRVNAITEPDGLRDLLAIREYAVRPRIVVIPKVESGRDLEIVEHVLDDACPDLELFAVIETPRGLQQANTIARASPRLRALIFGAADYSFSLGARRSWDCLLPARAAIINAARAAGIEVIDSPVFEVHDLEGLHWEAPMSKDMGFSGKAAIHPDQVPSINTAFSPDSDVLRTARRIVAADSHGVAVVDGIMVGRPFFQAAQRLLNEFESPVDALLPTKSKGES